MLSRKVDQDQDMMVAARRLWFRREAREAELGGVNAAAERATGQL